MTDEQEKQMRLRMEQQPKWERNVQVQDGMYGTILTYRIGKVERTVIHTTLTPIDDDMFNRVMLHMLDTALMDAIQRTWET